MFTKHGFRNDMEPWGQIPKLNEAPHMVNMKMASLHLSAVIRPFFGNADSVKCVVNEHGDTVYVKDVSLLLQLLDIEHPIGQLIVAVCQAHSRRYGSGVKSLLTLHGLLTEAYLSLCEQGIPPVDVIALMREALSDSMCRLSALQIPLTNHLHASPHNRPHTDSAQYGALPVNSDDFKEVLLSDCEKGIYEKDSTFIKPGSDITEMAETELIHLKMKQVHEDEDDIGWFFDDPVPRKERKSEEIRSGQTFINKCLETKDENQLISRSSDADQHDSDFDDCFEDGPSGHSSVTICEDNMTACDTGQQSACFSQGNPETKPMHIEGFVNLNDRYCKGFDPKASNRTVLDCGAHQSSQNHTVTEVVEDDFDSCFEDRELENKASTIAAVPDCTTKRIEPDLKSLNSLLKRIKSTKIDNTNVFISSRHFKQQAVSDAESNADKSDVHTQPTPKLSGMNADGNCGNDMMPGPKNLENNFQSELDRLDKMIENVKNCQQKFSETHLQTECSSTVIQDRKMPLSDETKMLGLVNLKKSQKRVLNSSRYFKTIESTLASMASESGNAESDRKKNNKATSSASKGYNFELILKEKLSEKKKEGLRNSLSHSRHFKTFSNVNITGDLGDRHFQDENRGGTSTDAEKQIDGVERRDQLCSGSLSDRFGKGNKEASSDDVQSPHSVHTELNMPSSRQLDSIQGLAAGADGVSGKGLESLQQASGQGMSAGTDGVSGKGLESLQQASGQGMSAGTDGVSGKGLESLQQASGQGISAGTDGVSGKGFESLQQASGQGMSAGTDGVSGKGLESLQQASGQGMSAGTDGVSGKGFESLQQASGQGMSAGTDGVSGKGFESLQQASGQGMSAGADGVSGKGLESLQQASGQGVSAGADGVSGKGLESLQQASGQGMSAGTDGVSGKGLESLQQASGMVKLLGSETFTAHPTETRDVASGRMKLDRLSDTCTTDHKCVEELSKVFQYCPVFCDKNGGNTVRCGERILSSGETASPLASDVPPSDMCWCDVADGLSHGCPEMMKLVVQAAASQMAMTRKDTLNLKLLHTCAVGGTPVRLTGVVPGLVTRCDSHTLSLIMSHTDKRWNVLLLNGDLSYTFRHKGYKDAVKGSCVEAVGHLSRQDRWLQHCVERLTELSVDMVLVKGVVGERVRDTLTGSGVVTVHNVPFRLLEALREATATELCVYVTEASKSHVCEGLCVRPYFPSWSDHLSTQNPQTAHIVLDTAMATALQTVVLCHPSSHANDIQEQEVGLCSHRLCNALHDGMVLPGGGVAEAFCAEYLQEKCSKKEDITCDLDLYRPVVTEAMADVFHKMGRLITSNCAHPHHTESLDDHIKLGSLSLDSINHSLNLPLTSAPSLRHNNTNKHGSSFPSPPCEVQGICCKNGHERSSITFDNYKSKMAAWSAAMDSVAMVTQTDAHVVTGVTPHENGGCGVSVNGIVL